MEDIDHYHRIVVALHETIRLMKEIDQVIDTHGGWPAAFSAITARRPGTARTEPQGAGSIDTRPRSR